MFVDSKKFKDAMSQGAATGLCVRKHFACDTIKQIDEERRQIEFVISTESPDRDGDVIKADGWELGNFMKNPVVLFGHDSSKPPIGKAINVRIEDGKLKSLAEFAPRETSEFADMIFKLYQGGFMRATSVGFQPIEAEFKEVAPDQMGLEFQKQELMEYSAVPVPANAEALVDAKRKGINTQPLKEWAEQALDEWDDSEHGGLLVPKSVVERIYKVADTRDSFKLTRTQQRKLREQNLAMIRSNSKSAGVGEPEKDEVTSSEKANSEQVAEALSKEAVSDLVKDILNDGQEAEQDQPADQDEIEVEDEATDEGQEEGEGEQVAQRHGQATRKAVADALRSAGVKRKDEITWAEAHPDGTPAADMEQSWDGPAEIQRADIDDLQVMATWVDEENPEVKAAYKLPHHLANSRHTVVWRGVVAAMATLLGARGGVDVPDEDRQGIYDHLARHYRDDFDREPPQFRHVQAQVLAGAALNENKAFAEDGEKIFVFDFQSGTLKQIGGDMNAEELEQEVKQLRADIAALKGEEASSSSDQDKAAAADDDIDIDAEQVKTLIEQEMKNRLKAMTGRLD